MIMRDYPKQDTLQSLMKNRIIQDRIRKSRYSGNLLVTYVMAHNKISIKWTVVSSRKYGFCIREVRLSLHSLTARWNVQFDCGSPCLQFNNHVAMNLCYWSSILWENRMWGPEFGFSVLNYVAVSKSYVIKHYMIKLKKNPIHPFRQKGGGGKKQ